MNERAKVPDPPESSEFELDERIRLFLRITRGDYTEADLYDTRQDVYSRIARDIADKIIQ